MNIPLVGMTSAQNPKPIRFDVTEREHVRGVIRRVIAAVHAWFSTTEPSSSVDVLRARLESLPPSSWRSRLLADVDDAEAFGFADDAWCAARMADVDERMGL